MPTNRLVAVMLALAVPALPEPPAAVPPPVEQLAANCASPTYASDITVCATPDLLALDTIMRSGLVKVGMAAIEPASPLIERQADWFRRRSQCAMAPRQVECLRAAYGERIAVLDGLSGRAEKSGRASGCKAKGMLDKARVEDSVAACARNKETMLPNESHVSSGLAVSEIHIDSTKACVDLTAKGLTETQVNAKMIGAAVADGASERIGLDFHKGLPVPGSSYRYYVFTLPGIHDAYRVYVVDEQNGRLRSKFTFNGLSYSPDFETCSYPGIEVPASGTR